MQRETYYVVRLDAPSLRYLAQFEVDRYCASLHDATRFDSKRAALAIAALVGRAHVLKVNIDAREVDE